MESFILFRDTWVTYLLIPWKKWWQTARRKEGVPEEYDTTYTVDGLYVYWSVSSRLIM